MTPDQPFTSTEVCRILNIELPRLQEWLRSRFLMPTSALRGRGRKAEFSITDLYLISLFAELLESGFNRKDAKIIVTKIQGRQTIRVWTTEPPADWERDCLFILRSPSFKNAELPHEERFCVAYGAPPQSHFFYRKNDVGAMLYWQLTIELKSIKNRVDREIG